MMQDERKAMERDEKSILSLSKGVSARTERYVRAGRRYYKKYPFSLKGRAMVGPSVKKLSSGQF
ncbi:MAG: hypothetical protein AAFP76_01045 [Bacteroidota bacterium]